MSTHNGDRRELIATSGIRIIAGQGVRALTHRAIDREAGLPEGTTSYHARTRDALLALIVEELTTRSIADTAAFAAAMDGLSNVIVGPDQLAAQITDLIESLTDRRDDMKARYALMLELDDRSNLRLRLTTHSDVHDLSERATASALAQAGLPHTREHAARLLTLADALVLYSTAIGDPKAREILANYLRGSLQQQDD